MCLVIAKGADCAVGKDLFSPSLRGASLQEEATLHQVHSKGLHRGSDL